MGRLLVNRGAGRRGSLLRRRDSNEVENFPRIAVVTGSPPTRRLSQHKFPEYISC